jgi:hypothetical protein
MHKDGAQIRDYDNNYNVSLSSNNAPPIYSATTDTSTYSCYDTSWNIKTSGLTGHSVTYTGTTWYNDTGKPATDANRAIMDPVCVLVIKSGLAGGFDATMQVQ